MFETFFSDPDLIYRINVINSIDFYSLGFEMVRGETKAENMLQWLRKGEVADVLVTNVQCPDMSGFELAETVRKYCPRVRVIFLADTPNCVIAQQVVRFGAYDFLLKSDGIDALRAALSRAAEELCAERRENAYLRSQTNPTLHAELSCQPHGPLRVGRLRRGFTRRNAVFQHKGCYPDGIQPRANVISLIVRPAAVSAARTHDNCRLCGVTVIWRQIRFKRILYAAVRHGLVP